MTPGEAPRLLVLRALAAGWDGKGHTDPGWMCPDVFVEQQLDAAICSTSPRFPHVSLSRFTGTTGVLVVSPVY